LPGLDQKKGGEVKGLKTFLIVKKGKRNGREVDKEDIVINTRLVLAKPGNELGTKRGGHRGGSCHDAGNRARKKFDKY
jgi:hypothetical protein